MNKWQVNNKSESPSVTDAITCDLIFYIDDLDINTIEDIIEIHNAGQGAEAIDEYLLNNEKCTQDEREFIIESINNYLTLDIVDNTTTVHEVAGTNIAAFIPGFATEPGTSVPEPAKTKKTWSRKPIDTSIKAVSPADYIKVLQEKMDIVRLLDAVEMPEIPTALTKGNRDIMVEFQKEHVALIAKYMERIQKA